MIFPKPDFDPRNIRIVMISECPPANRSDYFYESGSGAFFQTTQTAFRDAGAVIESYEDLTRMGIYLTTAIKCSKTGYLVSAKTIRECASRFLKPELDQFPDIHIIMCMGDFAIKAVNYIYKEKYGKNPIPAGSTYKIRKQEHIQNGICFLPSYTHTGDSFNIEKVKRQMIAEDIRTALSYLKAH
ncbi:MAG: uracil-DNA glycosylase family protein [Methanoregula sp.]|nr:uracil-DNA glycosylase family protein [Methanoregula sp.]